MEALPLEKLVVYFFVYIYAAAQMMICSIFSVFIVSFRFCYFCISPFYCSFTGSYISLSLHTSILLLSSLIFSNSPHSFQTFSFLIGTKKWQLYICDNQTNMQGSSTKKCFRFSNDRITHITSDSTNQGDKLEGQAWDVFYFLVFDCKCLNPFETICMCYLAVSVGKDILEVVTIHSTLCVKISA